MLNALLVVLWQGWAVLPKALGFPRLCARLFTLTVAPAENNRSAKAARPRLPCPVALGYFRGKVHTGNLGSDEARINASGLS